MNLKHSLCIAGAVKVAKTKLGHVDNGRYLVHDMNFAVDKTAQ
jgi:hypothetical protein